MKKLSRFVVCFGKQGREAFCSGSIPGDIASNRVFGTFQDSRHHLG